jgi:large subunit ribosomal protein L14
MYQTGTNLKITDNSGGVSCRVIKVYKNKKYGVLGDLVLVSITRNIAHSKLRKGNLSKAIVIRSNRGSSCLKDKGRFMWYNLK